MPTECTPDFFGFEPVEGREVVAAFDAGAITSDAGALLLGATDRAIKMMDRFASCFHDVRRRELIEHEVATLVGQRVFEIALGYEDLNDHDELRHDPMMAVLAGKLEARREDCAPVAGKSTLNRLELSRLEPTRYHKISHNPMAIRRLSWTCSWRRTGDLRSRSSLILIRPMPRCTGSKRVGSSTAITTAIATYRSTFSAGAICWPPSCGVRTSTAPPVPWKRWRALLLTSAANGRACAFWCVRTAGSRVRNSWPGARPTVWIFCSAWPRTTGSTP